MCEVLHHLLFLHTTNHSMCLLMILLTKDSLTDVLCSSRGSKHDCNEENNKRNTETYDLFSHDCFFNKRTKAKFRLKALQKTPAAPCYCRRDGTAPIKWLGDFCNSRRRNMIFWRTYKPQEFSDANLARPTGMWFHMQCLDRLLVTSMAWPSCSRVKLMPLCHYVTYLT